MDFNEKFFLGESYLTLSEISDAKKRHGNVNSYGSKVTGGPFLVTEKVSIFVMEGLSESVRVFSANNIPDNSYFYFTVPHQPFSESLLRNQINFFHDLTGGRFKEDSLIMLANTLEDLALARRMGLSRSIFCNHNCFIDEWIFKITRGCEYKRWDLIINTRPEYSFKRPYLAKKVQSLCIVKGALYREDDYWDLAQLNPKYINNNRISNVEVNNLINQSFVGGIFSAAEGACYSSSEFLLAGLPVVSTDSLGGRDYWYDVDNSIIVPPDENAISDAVAELKKRLLNGDITQEIIRKNHISKSNKLRLDFIESILSVVSENGLSIDVQSIFNAYFTDKFIRNHMYGYDLNR